MTSEMERTRVDLADVLQPKSVVIVGLSQRASALGRRVLANLQQGGFDGPIYGVHPSGEDVDGIPVYRRLDELPSAPTTGLVCTPSATVGTVLEELGAIGCLGAVVFASGFEETAAGAEQAAAMREVTGRYGMKVVGPNCIGVLNPGRGVWLTGTDYPEDLRPGHVAVVSQSGSGCILLTACGRLRFSYVISSGNESVVRLPDYLDHLVEDPATRVIGLVVEGLTEPERVLAAAGRAHDRGVPIVALKIGRTEVGARSVRSHTGAIAGDARAWDAFCARAGILGVRTYDELVECLVALSTLTELPRGRRVAAVGLSGGEVGLFGDLAPAAGIELASFSAATTARLAETLPGFATVANPLDATGPLVHDRDAFRAMATIVGEDAGVDLVTVVLDAPPSLSDGLAGTYEELIGTLPEVRRRVGKPVVMLSNYGGGLHDYVRRCLDGSDIPVVHGTVPGLAAIAGVAAVGAGRSRARSPAPAAAGPSAAHGPAAPARDRAVQRVREALAASPQGRVDDEVLAEVAAAYGLPLPGRARAAGAAEAVAAAGRIGYPVVVKTLAREVLHKTDVGGVVTGIRSDGELEAAYGRVVESVSAALGGAAPEVAVERMVTGGVEAFVGCRTDSVFGPLIAVGVGGTLVELYGDQALSLLPVTAAEVEELLRATRLGTLLGGFRGGPPADAAAFADLVVRVGQLALDCDEGVEIDFNPVAVLPAGTGATVLDMRIVAAGGG